MIHEEPVNYLSKTQKERHPARASSTNVSNKGLSKVKVLGEHGPWWLGALRSPVFQSKEEKVNRVLGPSRPPALLTTPPLCLAGTHPHLLVTYLRRSTAQASAKGEMTSVQAEQKHFRQLLRNPEDVQYTRDARTNLAPPAPTSSRLADKSSPGN